MFFFWVKKYQLYRPIFHYAISREANFLVNGCGSIQGATLNCWSTKRTNYGKCYLILRQKWLTEFTKSAKYFHSWRNISHSIRRHGKYKLQYFSQNKEKNFHFFKITTSNISELTMRLNLYNSSRNISYNWRNIAANDRKVRIMW